MKTLKEAAKDYAEITDKANAEFVAIDFIAGAEFAQKWKTISEEIPFSNQIILIRTKDYHLLYFSFFEKSENIFVTTQLVDFKPICISKENVKEWRYLDLK